MKDLDFAFRMVRKHPGSSAVIVLTLGLVIGVCSTLYTSVNYQLFRPPPVSEPDRLVRLCRTNESGDVGRLMDAARLAAYRRGTRTFSGLTAIDSQGMTLTGRGEPEHLQAARVSANFFAVFGIRPVVGRGFDAEAAVEGREAVIGFDLWRTHFGQDPDALGRTLVLNGAAYNVVGVMPEDVRRVEFAWGRDVWVAYDFEPSADPGVWVELVGRVKPGATLAQARAETEVLGRAIETAQDPAGGYDRATVVPYFQSHVDAEEILGAAFFLMSVLFVMLIACANVSSMLIARALSRRHELAIRLALGAGRRRLARQLLAEVVLLAALGGAVGLVLAKWTSDAIVRRGYSEIAFDWRVVIFTGGIALAAGVMAGLAPAVQCSRPDLLHALKAGGEASSPGRNHHRLRNGLVVAQIAMVMVLLIASGLMIRSFVALGRADPGYDTRNLAAIHFRLADQDYPDSAAKSAFLREALDNLRAVPGVKQVGLSALNLVSRYPGPFPFEIPDQSEGGGGTGPNAAINQVDDGFFELMETRVLNGRTFHGADLRTGPDIVVINETLATQYFPDQDPIGRTLALREDGDRRIYQIIGVVEDLRNIAFRDAPFAELFVPYTQAGRFWLSHTLLVRTAADPRTMAEPLREAVCSINRDQPVGRVSLVETRIRQLRQWNDEMRNLMWLLAGLGFGLSLIGIHGLVAYTVTERTREIGVRIAVGAARSDIYALIFRQGLRLVAIGGAFGTGIALAAAAVLDGLLYGISPYDPATYAAVLALVAGATLVASLAPARRAAAIDPMRALRTE